MISYCHVDFVFRSAIAQNLEPLKRIPAFSKVVIREKPAAYLDGSTHLNRFTAMINLGPFRDEDHSFLSDIVQKYLGEGQHLEIAKIQCQKELCFTSYFSETIQPVRINAATLELLSASGFEMVLGGETSVIEDENAYQAYIES